MQAFKEMTVTTYEGGIGRNTEALVIRELPLDIFVNGQFHVTVACSGLHVVELAVGLLTCEGVVAHREDIRDIETEQGGEKLTVHITVGEGNKKPNPQQVRPRPPEHFTCPSPQVIGELMVEFVSRASLHTLTRGTHGAALAALSGLIVVREDIGRHNCLDMLIGYRLLNSPERDERDEMFVLRTGRLSMEITKKIIMLGVPLVVSLGVPTTAALEAAAAAGITVIGAVREGQMNFYTSPYRP